MGLDTPTPWRTVQGSSMGGDTLVDFKTFQDTHNSAPVSFNGRNKKTECIEIITCISLYPLWIKDATNIQEMKIKLSSRSNVWAHQ